MRHLHYIKFLDNLSEGNDPKFIQMNERVRENLTGMNVGVGQFNPNAEYIENLIGEPIEAIQPFVFSLFDTTGVEKLETEEELSLPFKATWIEMFDQPLITEVINGRLEIDSKGSISITPEYENELSSLQVIKGKRVRSKLQREMIGALIIEPENPKEAYSVVMFEETRLLSVHADDQGEKLFEAVRQKYGDKPITRESYAGMLYHSMASGPHASLGPEGKLYRIAQFLLSSMRKASSEAGTIRVDEKAKVGTGKNRRLMKVKNLVIVAPKKQKAILADHVGARKEIDWSHRWDVMGHWRKISGIGKDRSGSYTIKGYTWVIAHVKGPEDKILVRKTRLVQGEE